MQRNSLHFIISSLHFIMNIAWLEKKRGRAMLKSEVNRRMRVLP